MASPPNKRPCLKLHNQLEWHKTSPTNYVTKETLIYDPTHPTLILYTGAPALHTCYYTVHDSDSGKWEWQSFKLDTSLTIDWRILNTTLSRSHQYAAIRVSEHEIKLIDTQTTAVVAARAVKSTTTSNCMMLNACFIYPNPIDIHIIFVTTLGCELYHLLPSPVQGRRLQHLRTIQISGLFMHWMLGDVLLILDARQKLYAYKLTTDLSVQFNLPVTVTKQRNVQLCYVYDGDVPYIVLVDDVKHVVYIYSISFRLNSVLLLYSYTLSMHTSLTAQQPARYNVQCIDNCVVVCECTSNTVAVIDTFTDSTKPIVASTQLSYTSSTDTVKQFDYLSTSRILYPNMVWQATGEQYEGRMFGMQFDYDAVRECIDTPVHALSCFLKRTVDPQAAMRAALQAVSQQIETAATGDDSELSVLKHMFVLMNGAWDDYDKQQMHSQLPASVSQAIDQQADSYLCDVVDQLHDTDGAVLHHHQHMLITQYELYMYALSRTRDPQHCVDIIVMYAQTIHKQGLLLSLLLSDCAAKHLVALQQHAILHSLVVSDVLQPTIAIVQALMAHGLTEIALQMCRTIAANKSDMYSEAQRVRAQSIHIAQLVNQNQCVPAIRILANTHNDSLDIDTVQLILNAASASDDAYAFYWTYTWLTDKCRQLNMPADVTKQYRNQFVKMYGEIDGFSHSATTPVSSDAVVHELPLLFDNHVNV